MRETSLYSLSFGATITSANATYRDDLAGVGKKS